MMAALFIVYVVCLLLVGWRRQNTAFALMLLNVILCALMLMNHMTDILNTRV